MMVFALSVLACVTLVLLEGKLRPHYLRTGDTWAVQASHTGDPLRIGGLAVILAHLTGVVLEVRFLESATGLLVIVSAMPVFFAGVLEDWGKRVSPRDRLLAGFIAAILAVALLGVWVPRGDMAGVDWLMGFPFFAICLTVTFSAGLCHALNLVDGMNGLASIVSMSSSLGIASVALLASQTEIMVLGVSLAAAVAGFFLVNWPRARLFLGDAGAYTIGHILAWLAVLLLWRADAVAAPAMLLLLFWPLADALHTIIRRFAKRAAVSRPDKMHLHQKVRRTLDIVWFGRAQRSASNPMTTLVLLPFIVAPVVTGIALWNNAFGAWIALGAYLLAFSAAHPLLIWGCRRYRK